MLPQQYRQAERRAQAQHHRPDDHRRRDDGAGQDQHDREDQDQRRGRDDQQVVVGAVLHVLVQRRAPAQVDRRAGQRRALDGVLGGDLQRVDARGALLGQRVALVDDGEPHRMPVRRQEQLDAALEFGGLERLRRQIERVVVLGGVERLTHRGGVVLHRHRLILLRLLDLILRQHDLFLMPHGLDHRIHQRDHLRHQRRHPLEIGNHGGEVLGHRPDAVEAFEHRAQRPAHRDVETVRLPVEVVADRAEEVVEVRQVVADVGDRRAGVLHLVHHAVGDLRHLLGQRLHLRHRVDADLHVVGLGEHVVQHLLDVVVVHDLPGAVGAQRVRDRRVLDRLALRAGDGLHLGDAAHVDQRLGDLVDDQEVGRVA